MRSPPFRNPVRSTIQKRDARGVIRNGAEWLAIWSDPESMKSGAEKEQDAEALATRLQIEKSLSAAARSVAADPDLRLNLASIAESGFAAGDVPALRGKADSAALWRRFHDPALHARLRPGDPAAARLFDLCERVRCDALGAAMFPGIRDNLVAQHYRHLENADMLNAHLALLIPVAEGLRMVLRDALLGVSEPSIDSTGMRMWDRWLRERFSSNFEAIKRVRHDQAEFSRLSASFVSALLAEIGSDEGLKLKLRPSRSATEENTEDPDEDAEFTDRLREEPEGSVLRPGAVFHDLAQEHEIAFAPSESQPLPEYKAFTTAHDRVAFASDLFDSVRLRELRDSLERRRSDLRRDLARLAARFQRRLLARQTRDWDFDLDEGLLDASRLDRVIVNPGFASAYKQERESRFPDTVVSILIDNSGSMRGKPIEIACLAADLISAALDRCTIASEVLGFTTREWKGGQSAKEWVKSGRPADPGRLNDLLHIVYKSAAEPARRARANLAAMLDPDILKENIDGEALLWAARRLFARPERRRILIVISDGAPVDQATLEFNSDKQMLDRHLRQVIRDIENSGSVELAALGVKHETSEYYRNSVYIDTPEKLGDGLIALVDRFLVSGRS